LSIRCFPSLIASELAHFHSLPFRDAFLRLVTEEKDRSLCASLVNQLALFPRLREWITRLPNELSNPKDTNRYISEFPTVSVLQSEVNTLESLLESACSPIVLCHNDLLAGNIIVSPDENTVSFIDLEYCAFGHAAFDIGNHFCEYAGVEPTDYSKYPSLPFQREWIKSYLWAYHNFQQVYTEEHSSMNGYCSQSTGDDRHSFDCFLTDVELDRWLREVNYFALVAHLIWSIWAVIRATDKRQDFDFLSYAFARINEYFRLKPILLATFNGNQVPTDFIDRQ
ncbi:hypothetical protein EG68_08058, partial [Paragonimus skrjabini miyazakii]